MNRRTPTRGLRGPWAGPILAAALGLFCAASVLMGQDDDTPSEPGKPPARPPREAAEVLDEQPSPAPPRPDPGADRKPVREREGDTPAEGGGAEEGRAPLAVETTEEAEEGATTDGAEGAEGEPDREEAPSYVVDGAPTPSDEGRPKPAKESDSAEESLSEEDRHRAQVRAEGRRLSEGRRESMLGELDVLTAPPPAVPEGRPGEESPPPARRDAATILEGLTRLAQTSRIELAACQRDLASHEAALIDAAGTTARLRARLSNEPEDVKEGRRLISEALLSIDQLAEEGLRHEQTFNALRKGLGDIDDASGRYEELLARAQTLQAGLDDARGSAADIAEARRLATETVTNLQGCVAAALETKRLFLDTLSAVSKNVAFSADLSRALAAAIYDAQELSLGKRDPVHLRLSTLQQASTDLVAGVRQVTREIGDGAWLTPLRDQGGRLALLVVTALMGVASVYALARPLGRALEQAGEAEQAVLWRRRQLLPIARSGISGAWLAVMSWACLFPVYALWLAGVVGATIAAWLTTVRALALLLGPQSPHRVLLPESNNVRPVYRALVVLATVTAFFLPAELSMSHTDYGATDVVGLVYLLHTVTVLLLMLWLLRVARPLVREDLAQQGRAARLLGAAIPYGCMVAVAIVALQALGYTNLTRLVGRGLPLTGALFYGLYLVERKARAWLKARHPSPEGRTPSRRSQADDTLELRAVAWDLLLGLERLAALAAAVWALSLAWGLHRPHWNYLNMLLSGSLVEVHERQISLAGIVRAGIVAYLVFYVARMVQRLIEHSPALARRYGPGVRYASAHLFLYVMCTIGMFWALMEAGLDLSVLTVFAGMAGIGLGFGLQDIVRNFVSGLILLVERPMEVDDLIQAGENFGYVTDISLRSTVLRTFDNRHIIVPNSTFIAETINNYSHRDLRLGVDVDVGVSYGSDLPYVRSVLFEVAERDPYILKDPAPTVWIMGFGESSIDFRLRVWVPRPDISNTTRTRMILAIHHAFRVRDIEIPYPQRDLHVRSAVPVPISDHQGAYGLGSPPPEAPKPTTPYFVPDGGVWDIAGEDAGE